jgi:hypothetical protein
LSKCGGRALAGNVNDAPRPIGRVKVAFGPKAKARELAGSTKFVEFAVCGIELPTAADVVLPAPA